MQIVSYTLLSTNRCHLMKTGQRRSDKWMMLCGRCYHPSRGEQAANSILGESYCGDCAYKHRLISNRVGVVSIISPASA